MKFQEMKQNFMAESALIEKPDCIQFLITSLQEALGKQKIITKLLLRGSRDGMSAKVFHSLCDNKGPLLVLIKTRKDILCGGFSSIHWRNIGDFTVDKKCFIFSLKLCKLYKRLDDRSNLWFNKNWGPCFGSSLSLGIINNLVH